MSFEPYQRGPWMVGQEPPTPAPASAETPEQAIDRMKKTYLWTNVAVGFVAGALAVGLLGLGFSAGASRHRED